MQYTELWKFLAGIGFFLYGMGQLEHILKTISGRRLKLFLKKNTKNIFTSILGGAFVTAIVQSSSVVSLIVLAFVESGIIKFKNALGVILGANIGTTITGWLVVFIGFKLDILNYALPVIAISSLGKFFSGKRKNLNHLFSVFFALGILFLGLGFMKESALKLVIDFDLGAFSNYPTFMFVIVGFVLTSIIQSSSATVAITLTALHSGVIDFSSAASLVIGAEVGTTLTILIWGIKGSADKKRTAWSNFYYNIFNSSIAYTFLKGFIFLISEIVKITDPLISLVFFQTSINIVAIIIFVPFMNTFTKWIEKKFSSNMKNENSYLSQNLPITPLIAASESIFQESQNLFNKSTLFIYKILCEKSEDESGILKNIKSLTQSFEDIDSEYAKLKQTEGDLLNYYAQIQENNIGKEESYILMNCINAARQSVYASKAIKDILHNLKSFEASANDTLHEQTSIILTDWTIFNELLKLYNDSNASEKTFELIEKLLANIQDTEKKQNILIINYLKKNMLTEVEASTLMNVFHELYLAKKSLLRALKGLKYSVENSNRQQEIESPS